MIGVIHEDFKRTADFHYNILLNLRAEYKTLNSNMLRDLNKWKEWNLPEVHSAALNYYKNYSLYLQYKIESHQKYYDLFHQKSELLHEYIELNTPKQSRFASVKSKIKNFLKSNKNSENSDSETSNDEFSRPETTQTDTDLETQSSSPQFQTNTNESDGKGYNINSHIEDVHSDELGGEEDVIIKADHPTNTLNESNNHNKNIHNNTNIINKKYNVEFKEDPLLGGLSINTSSKTISKQKPKLNISNLNHINAISRIRSKSNSLSSNPNSIQTISKAEETVLLKANSIKIDEDIKQLEDNINALQLVVDSLYIIYDKAKDHNKKLDPIERKKLLETLLEDSLLACLPTSALNPLSTINNNKDEHIDNNNDNNNNSKKDKQIVIDGIAYFPFNNSLYDRLDLFLKDKRYREGVFVDRWISLCKKNIVNLLNKKNSNTDFYNKLINETLRILKIEYGLNIVFPDDEQYQEAGEYQTYFSILQLGVERFYFSRLKRDIIGVFNMSNALKGNSIIAGQKGTFKKNQGILSNKLEQGDFDVIGIKKKFTVQEYIDKFKAVIKEIETACTISAPTDITYHLVNTVRLICEVLREDVYGKDEGLSADSIFPYIVFVLIFTNVNNINEIFWYLEKVAERKTRSGEMGVCVSMMHAATVWINEYKE